MASILLVDDSPTIRSILRLELTNGGHAVVIATCGNEAVRLLQEHAVDLVVTDIYMPNGDGLEVLTAVRRMGKRPAAIAMSSMAGEMDMLPSARLLGAKVILTKPFPSGELLRRANELLGASSHPADRLKAEATSATRSLSSAGRPPWRS